jgi:predicted AAA+ superfamily ATPase
MREPGYRERLIDPIIARDLRVFGAVSLEGPKWCGKTWTCLNHSASVFYLMDEEGDFANRRLAELDPAAALDGPAPRLLDEWQEVPALWDAVRFRVDRSAAKGRFTLTGSTRPRSARPRHSGTGRIAVRRMRPMSLLESGLSSGTASLGHLLAGGQLRPARSGATLGDVLGWMCRGGWPGIMGLDTPDAQVLARGYIDRLADADMGDVADARRDPVRTLAFLRSLARHTATPVQIPTLRRDMGEAWGASATDVTVRRYLDDLANLYALEEIPAWQGQLRSKSALRKTPKRMLADPSLAAAALGADPSSLRADLETAGFVFESMCLRDLLVFSEMLGASLTYYRDEDGLEADAVVTMADGTWGAVEMKLGGAQVEQAAANLRRLADKLSHPGRPAPAMLAVLVGVAGLAETRADGVHVIPVDMLGP